MSTGIRAMIAISNCIAKRTTNVPVLHAPEHSIRGARASSVRATATMARRIVGQRRKEMTERNVEALVDLYLEGEERADIDRELEQNNAELRALPSGGADLYGSRYPLSSCTARS